ncbi:MAG: HAMP domain-containing histidine kinase [Pseudomonadota bacterium]|nr:HAMP domain-containing histidine kinase [Pseudomonadota bacterium]
MATYVLQRNEIPVSPSGRAAERILKNCERLRRTLDALSDYSHASLGAGLPLAKSDTDLGTLCRAAGDAFLAEEPRRRLRLERRGDLHGVWDSNRLLQSVEALLTNASRLAPREGEIVLLADGDARDRIAVSIQSDGSPIDAQSFKEIFEPHQRSDPSRSTYAGLGLGLFIVREVVEAHGGSIDVAVNDIKRTTVTVSLPRA